MLLALFSTQQVDLSEDLNDSLVCMRFLHATLVKEYECVLVYIKPNVNQDTWATKIGYIFTKSWLSGKYIITIYSQPFVDV